MGLGTVNALVRLPLHDEQTQSNLLAGKLSSYWLMWDESQTVSLPFHQSVEQDENLRCGLWLNWNDRFNLVLMRSRRRHSGSKDYTQYTAVQIEEKCNPIGLLINALCFKSDPTRYKGLKTMQTTTTTAVWTGKALFNVQRQARQADREKNRKSFQPQQSKYSLQLPPSSQTSPLSSHTSHKWRGNEVSILAFQLSWES